jgi:hypothetical protein
VRGWLALVCLLFSTLIFNFLRSPDSTGVPIPSNQLKLVASRVTNYRVLKVAPSCSTLLEFIAGPQCPVIQVVAWLTLFDKLACIKNSVVGLKPKMSVRLPVNLRARPVSNEARIAVSRGNNQKSGDGIHSIPQALPPLKDPIDGDTHAMRQRRFSVRVYVNKIEGAGASRGENAEIIALGK